MSYKYAWESTRTDIEQLTPWLRLNPEEQLEENFQYYMPERSVKQLQVDNLTASIKQLNARLEKLL